MSSSVLVAGLGDVGVRTARQLLDTPGVDRVVVAARRLDHAKSVAAALHDGATPWELGFRVARRALRHPSRSRCRRGST